MGLWIFSGNGVEDPKFSKARKGETEKSETKTFSLCSLTRKVLSIKNMLYQARKLLKSTLFLFQSDYVVRFGKKTTVA